jgi:membrane protein implicated in regulation of membrane protease activity
VLVGGSSCGLRRWFGILVAALSSIGALLSIPAYPFWSLAIFAIDVLIIYGLAAYGGRRATRRRDGRLLVAREQLRRRDAVAVLSRVVLAQPERVPARGSS